MLIAMMVVVLTQGYSGIPGSRDPQTLKMLVNTACPGNLYASQTFHETFPVRKT
jgi:hypothetical protein